MIVEIMVLAAVATAIGTGFILGRRRTDPDLPKVEPLEEGELIRVGMMNEDDPAVRAPLHVAEAMRTAKCLSVGESMNGIVPSTEKVAESVWMAAGYVAACAEFERLWMKVREDAKRAEGER